MSKRKPHNDILGYVCELQNRITGVGHVVIYDRNKGFECDADSRYVVVCETHGTMVSDTSLPRARMSMKSVEFCQECNAQQSLHPTSGILPDLHAVSTPQPLATSQALSTPPTCG